MVAERFELRIDKQLRQRLDQLAAEHGLQASEMVRRLIDEAYEAADRERRLAAARRIGEAQLEDVPPPDVLKRQLESAHEPSGLP